MPSFDVGNSDRGPNFVDQIKKSLSLLATGHVGAFLYQVMKHAWSDETCFALRRDLRLPFTPPPPAAIPLRMRPFRSTDAQYFADSAGLWRKIIRTRIDEASRTALIKAYFPSVYVAVTADGEPCFIHWVMAPSADGKTASYRKAHVLPLSDDEVLIEGAFVPERHRGKRIQTYATTRGIEILKDLGARWVVAHAYASNIISLRGLLSAGFHPYLLAKVTWRAFRGNVSVVPIREEEALRLEASWKRPTGKSGSLRMTQPLRPEDANLVASAPAKAAGRSREEREHAGRLGGNTRKVRRQMANARRVIAFAEKYACAAASCFYLFALGFVFPRNRRILFDICVHFGVCRTAASTRVIPEVKLSELVRDETPIELRQPLALYGNPSALELTVINKLIRQNKPINIFEIGTFDGRTTLNMACNAPREAKVFTLDLPPGLEQFPVRNEALGSKYLGTDCESKVVQLYGDSATFDFSLFINTIDFVFVDGSHLYDYVMNDSRIALKLMRDGRGVILWHNYDANSAFLGAVRALNECYSRINGFEGLRHIEGTSIVCLILGNDHDVSRRGQER